MKRHTIVGYAESAAAGGAAFSLMHSLHAHFDGRDLFSAASYILPAALGAATGALLYGAYTRLQFTRQLLQIKNQRQMIREESRNRSLELLKKLSLAVERSPAMVIIMDDSGIVEYVNERYTEITGYDRHEIVGHNPGIISFCLSTPEDQTLFWSMIRAGQNWHTEMKNSTKEGDEYWESVSVSPILHQGKLTHLIILKEDITEQKRHEEIIHFRAYHDVLTGLPNRFMLYEVFALAKHITNINNQLFALLFIDVDNFKSINDTFGHHMGDELLKHFAGRMKETIGREDIIFRWSGDEFIIFTDVPSMAHAEEMARSLLKSFSRPFTVMKHELYLSVGIGITFFPTDADDINNLLKAADLALAQAKKQGRERFFFYSSEMNAEVHRRTELSNLLHKAVNNDEFFVHYQPKVDIATGNVIGCEALVRWNSPVLGIVSPAQFIPIAEENGLITQIGEHVLHVAARQAAEWIRAGHNLTVAINLSSRQFREKNLVETILSAVKQYNVPTHMIELEITESIMMENVDRAIDVLKELHGHGFKIAVDDFGTGYSSLRYLQKFPIDSLKIDRSFIIRITEDANSLSIVKAIIAMAKSMDIKLVAEGVDEMTQLQILRALDCDYLQGYLFSRPVSPAEFEQILHKTI